MNLLISNVIYSLNFIEEKKENAKQKVFHTFS